ncbi:MAG TPA: PLD nuclease N-terminal domain-containing protein [Kineosporiaceae bacterium]|nr:PLD nuclease N-terminal domain-containing protein [Kineosporiaceae bacterium]
MLRVVVVLVAVGLMVYALVDCLRADARDLRLLPRPVWLLAILVPIVGAVLYLMLGGRPARLPVEPASRPLAPDDDPEFLRRLDTERRRRQADEERRRRRERQEGNGGSDGDDHTGHPA